MDTASLLAAPGDILPRPFANCYWLIPGRVLAGEYPGASDPAASGVRMEALVANGVRHLIDLTTEGEGLPPYAAELQRCALAQGARVDVRRFPIADFGVPSAIAMRATLAAIEAAMAAGDVTYLHCHGGIGRTGTVGGCLLVEQGCAGADAVSAMDRKWRVMAKYRHGANSPETPGQRAFVAGWHAARVF